MLKDTLKKAGKIYGEGMKTFGEDLFEGIKGNVPQKRGLVGRLKQAAAIGATMLTLGGIGSIKNGIQQQKIESENKANIEHMEQSNGWMLSAPQNSTQWSLDGDYSNLSPKQQREHKAFLFSVSGYLKTCAFGDGESAMYDSIKERQNMLKEKVAKGDKEALLNYQFSLVIEKEVNRIMKQAHQEKSQLGQKEFLKSLIKNIDNQQANLIMQDYARTKGKSY